MSTDLDAVLRQRLSWLFERRHKICEGLAIPAAELLADGKSSPAYEALQISLLTAKLRAIRELASE